MSDNPKHSPNASEGSEPKKATTPFFEKLRMAIILQLRLILISKRDKELGEHTDAVEDIKSYLNREIKQVNQEIITNIDAENKDNA